MALQIQRVTDVSEIIGNLVISCQRRLPDSVPMDQLTLLSRLLSGICDVAINLSALTTHSVVVTAMSPGPSPSICSVHSLSGWFLTLRPDLSTCICVSVFVPV